MVEHDQHPRKQDFNDYTSAYSANIIKFYHNDELNFLREELTFYIARLSDIDAAITEYENSNDPIKELQCLRLELKKSAFDNKITFLKNKLHSLGLEIQIENGIVRFEERELQKIPAADLKFEGKKLNIKERYILANCILGLDSTISKLNVSEEEKATLIAYIFGTDYETAKKVKNNSYPVNARKDKIADYVNKLKGVDK